MTNLKRKLTVLFFAVVFLGASLVVTSCKKEQTPPKKPTPSTKKLPDME